MPSIKALLFVAFCASLGLCQGSRHDLINNPNAKEWSIRIVEPGEPGVRLAVTGVVYQNDGKTPLVGARLYVYQTDNEGYYSPGGQNESNPRLRGWILTNDSGAYRIETIRPAPYPHQNIPAHIHYIVTAEGHEEERIELRFEDDPKVSSRERERSKAARQFGWVKPVVFDESGALKVEFNIRVSD